jgi:hypothetical protein
MNVAFIEADSPLPLLLLELLPLPFHAPFRFPQPLMPLVGDEDEDEEEWFVFGGLRKICMSSVCCMKANWSAVLRTDDVTMMSSGLEPLEEKDGVEGEKPSPRQEPTGIVKFTYSGILQCTFGFTCCCQSKHCCPLASRYWFLVSISFFTTLFEYLRARGKIPKLYLSFCRRR